jgi:hypothetical protein
VLLRALLAVCLCSVVALATAQDAAALRARHAALQAQLAASLFGRPLQVESTVGGGAHNGDVYAVIEQPFDAVAPALARPASWCDILLLQVNIKRCETGGADTLTAHITRKPHDAVESAYRVDFRYPTPATSADYVRAELAADSGPVGTRGYRILLEATPLENGRTFLHLSYAYKLGWAARLAMDAYLAGGGRDKPGFSVDGGERAVVERGAMRHYLAIEAYLGSRDNLETRLRRWYAAIAQYPQLRERVSAEEYVEMKRRGAG